MYNKAKNQSRYSAFRGQRHPSIEADHLDKKLMKISCDSVQDYKYSDSNIKQTRKSHENNASPILKKFQAKFFTFLNQFSRKLSQLHDVSSPSNNLQSSQTNFKSEVYEKESQSILSIRDQAVTSQTLTKKKGSRFSRQRRQSIQIIQAKMENGKFNGPAKLILKNGGIFTGETKNGQLKKGNVCYQSGLLYQGQFQDNVFHGPSSIKLPNGNHILLKWNKGNPENKGQIKYENGEHYIGGIKNFKKHGFGELRLKDGKKYVGQFQKGQISGKGTYFDQNGNSTIQGNWSKGKYLGVYVSQSSSSSDIIHFLF